VTNQHANSREQQNQQSQQSVHSKSLPASFHELVGCASPAKAQTQPSSRLSFGVCWCAADSHSIQTQTLRAPAALPTAPPVFLGFGTNLSIASTSVGPFHQLLSRGSVGGLLRF
jgi:hypothetical protein